MNSNTLENSVMRYHLSHNFQKSDVEKIRRVVDALKQDKNKAQIGEVYTKLRKAKEYEITKDRRVLLNEKDPEVIEKIKRAQEYKNQKQPNAAKQNNVDRNNGNDDVQTRN
jgi:hypothetical protein